MALNTEKWEKNSNHIKKEKGIKTSVQLKKKEKTKSKEGRIKLKDV